MSISPSAFTRVALAALCLLIAAVPVAAQVDYEIMSALQFNFSNPGARSLAMAGALTGAGDDATGAWTNPGGLTNIVNPEVGFEFRGFGFSTPFVNQGRLNGDPRQIGIDSVRGLSLGKSASDTRSLSFVSAVVPWSRLAIAGYRTEVANYETDLESQGAYYTSLEGETVRLLPVSADLRLKVANVGASAAFRLTDQISVGGGVSYYTLDLQSRSLRYRLTGLGPNIAGGFYGPPLKTDDNVTNNQTITGDDSAVGVNLGASVSLTERIRIGASFRQGPGFDIAFTNSTGLTDEEATPSRLTIPDVFATGVLLRPTDALNVTVDYRRVRYSRLTKGMETGFASTSGVDDFTVHDGNEVRAAGEYLFKDLSGPFSLLAVRGGVWFDPDHRIRYNGPLAASSVLFALPDSKGEAHVTAGGGVVLGKFQIDVGYDHSARIDTVALSAIMRF